MKKIFIILSLYLVSILSVWAQAGNTLPIINLAFNSKPFNPYFLNGIVEFPVIELFPGDTMRFVVSTHDINNDSISITSNFTSLFPGATFNVTSARNPVSYIYWVPTNADVSLVPVTFTVQVSDHASPTIGIQSLGFEIRVNKLGSITSNNARVDLNQEIVLQPGTPMNLRFSSVNPALPDSIKITTTATSVLTGATFNRDNAKQQTADISWTPTAAHLNSQPYLFTVTYQDNAPVPKQYVYTIRVRVSNVMGVKEELSRNSFYAYPNPFTEVIKFKIADNIKAERLEIYNLLGQQVDQILIKHSNAAQQEISFSRSVKLAKGTYIARLISEDKTLQTLRFIKQ